MNYTKLWGVGEALAPPNLGENNNKVLPLKRPSHKPKFKKRRCSFQSSDNGDDEIWGAEKTPADVGKKRSKAYHWMPKHTKSAKKNPKNCSRGRRLLILITDKKSKHTIVELLQKALLDEKPKLHQMKLEGADPNFSYEISL